MAEDSGVIMNLTQKRIMTASNFPLNVIKDVTYDTNKGHNPRRVRFWTTPPTRSAYQPLLPNGNDTYSVVNPQTGVAESVTGDKRGRGCSLGADKMQWGYDVQQRCLQGRAFEAGPWCVLDLIEKMAWEEAIARIRADLPRYAKEQFARQLLRDVITYSKTKYSVAEGFPQIDDQAYFPAVATGGPSIGFIRQIQNQMVPWGYNDGAGTPLVNGRPAFRVYGMSDQAVEWAIQQRKTELGFEVNTTAVEDDKRFGKTVIYEGIQFLTEEMPMRGYLIPVAGGAQEFVEIDPYLIVPADGEGFKTIPNPEYYGTHATVGGERRRILEVGFIIHPEAMQRESLGAINAPGQQSARFDFSVRPLDPWELQEKGCNKDRFFFGYRVLHAYAPMPLNPELMTAFLYVAPIAKYTITDPWVDSATPTAAPTTLAPLMDPPVSGCDPADQPTEPDRDPTGATCTDLFPANGVGTIRLNQSEYVVEEGAGNLTVVVERVGGSSGSASAVVTITEGTATSPENYGTPSGFASPTGSTKTKTLSWADEEYGVKSFNVPLVEAEGDDDGKTFTIGLGTFSGAAAGSITSATVTILDEDNG